jgi:hypothetical protein
VSHRKQLTGRRVVHKSTGGILPSIPEPVDAVGNAAPLKSNTVASTRLPPGVACPYAEGYAAFFIPSSNPQLSVIAQLVAFHLCCPGR